MVEFIKTHFVSKFEILILEFMYFFEFENDVPKLIGFIHIALAIDRLFTNTLFRIVEF